MTVEHTGCGGEIKTDFKRASGDDADVFAVQGFDTGSLMIQGMNVVKGDTGATKELTRAMGSARIDSPRGMFSFSKANHPIQDIYLREVKGGVNKVIGVAAKALEDPAAHQHEDPSAKRTWAPYFPSFFAVCPQILRLFQRILRPFL